MHVDLLDVDVKRLSKRYRENFVEDLGETTVQRDETRGPLAGAKVCRCVALAGVPGERVRCRIYARRPDACRGFAPGSEGCREYRAILESNAQSMADHRRETERAS